MMSYHHRGVIPSNFLRKNLMRYSADTALTLLIRETPSLPPATVQEHPSTSISSAFRNGWSRPSTLDPMEKLPPSHGGPSPANSVIKCFPLESTLMAKATSSSKCLTWNLQGPTSSWTPSTGPNPWETIKYTCWFPSLNKNRWSWEEKVIQMWSFLLIQQSEEPIAK